MTLSPCFKSRQRLWVEFCLTKSASSSIYLRPTILAWSTSKMRTSLGPLLLALLLVALALAEPSPSYFDDDESMLEEYPSDNELDRLLQTAQKRSSLIYLYRRACVRRGGNCDHRPNDCCYNSSCRCNLWGANCRCQRKGLFQKWGK